jgi:hypothetical protein
MSIRLASHTRAHILQNDPTDPFGPDQSRAHKSILIYSIPPAGLKVGENTHMRLRNHEAGPFRIALAFQVKSKPEEYTVDGEPPPPLRSAKVMRISIT